VKSAVAQPTSAAAGISPKQLQDNRVHAAHCISEYTETRAKTPALPFSLKTAILLVSSHHRGLRELPERLCNFRLYIVEGGISRHNSLAKVWS
jgi:hypothetical protein